MFEQDRTESGAPEQARGDSLDLLLAVARSARMIVGASLLVGVLALGAAFMVKPTYTATTVLLPPQQQQSLAASALSSLGALAGLAGGAAGIKSPLDQYVALIQSTTIADRIIEHFKLDEVYDEEYRSNTRRELSRNVRIAAGKRDGLITIEVDDEDPKRAAAMAAAFVEEFRRITSELAITEAQQRKVFFEKHLAATKQRLIEAQTALQSSGISGAALKAEPKAAAEGYAKLKAEYTTAQVRLQALLSNFTVNAPEVQQAQSVVSALKGQLDRVESSLQVAGEGAEYVSKYREFKYQETLFELFARQFELARVDESREGGLVQVVDPALVPDRKSKPRRATVAIAATLVSGVALTLFVLLRARWRLQASPIAKAKLAGLWPALSGKA